MSYLVFLGLYSYFLTVEFSPEKPTASEVLVWIWAITLWLEELRQVLRQHYSGDYVEGDRVYVCTRPISRLCSQMKAYDR